jgi:predicted Zn-dependent peptidase
VIEVIREVLNDVAENGMTEDEISRAKGLVKGTMVLNQEDSGARMMNIGKSEIVYGEIKGFDQVLKEISEVTPEAVKKVAGEILVQKPTLALIGPFRSAAKFEKILGA